MVLKRLGKRGSKQKKSGKTSLAKLSNKHLNKLARQGKLKKHPKADRQKVLHLIKERLDPTQSQELTFAKECREDEDIPLEEADYEFYSRPGRDFGFLHNGFEKPQPSSRKRRVEETEDVTKRHEKKPRTLASHNKAPAEQTLLPIKSGGKIIHRSQTDSDRQAEILTPGPMDSQEPDQAESVEKLPTLSAAQIFRQHKEAVAQKKHDIALLANSIIEQPEEGMKKLKDLCQLLNGSDVTTSLTVTKITMVSLLEVFRDILPSYRIRVTTDAEKSQSTKKETKKLRDFEEMLLANYRHYLESLEVILRGKSASMKKKGSKSPKTSVHSIPLDWKKRLRPVALRCLCELLVSHPHFNYRTNIISLVIPQCVDRDAKTSSLVCDYVKRIFRMDKSREVTLEVIRLIGRLIKARHFDVNARVLQTFLALKIKAVSSQTENKAQRKKEARNMSRKDRKRQKQMKALEMELEDAAVSRNMERTLKLNTEIVNMIFLTYFRILKTAQHSALLPTVLEGLARFAHLINVDFFDDLFNVISGLIDSNTLTHRESLHCLQTAFVILSGQGEALNIDPNYFYTHLYNTMLEIHAGLSSDEIPVALTCLDLMIGKRKKQVSRQRVLAFFKRAVTLCLQLSAAGSAAFLCLARHLSNTFSQSDVLFDVDSQGSGMFRPELSEPEHCNAHQTSLYELHLLKRCFHPLVRNFATHLSHQAPSQGRHTLPTDLTRKNPEELYHELHENLLKESSLFSKSRRASKHQKVRLVVNIQSSSERDLDPFMDTTPESIDFYGGLKQTK